ncbi:MAG: hypothetical protein GYA36_23395 [Veillonellaceae bacterium]|nr:hypothetical protein [Veillonellaceae bacterium]
MNVDDLRVVRRTSKPTAPPSGFDAIYTKSDGLFIESSSGTETKLGPFTSGFPTDKVYATSSSGLRLEDENSNGMTVLSGGNVSFDKQVKILGGSPGANKLLSSDSVGLGSWGYTVVTTLGNPGSDSNVPTEKAIRSSLSAIHTQNTDQYLDYGGSNQVSAAQAKAAFTNINKDQYLDYEGTNQISAAQLKKFYKHELNFNFSGGGVVISSGVHGGLQVPFACTIKKVRLLSVDATSGSITVQVWKGTYSSPPTSGNSIGSWSISSSTKSETTGLSISLNSEDILYFYVDSVTSLKLVLMVIEVEV